MGLPMERIIYEILSGKMNLRKLVLWAFAIYLMLVAGRVFWSIGDAVVAVAEYSEAHPSSWVTK